MFWCSWATRNYPSNVHNKVDTGLLGVAPVLPHTHTHTTDATLCGLWPRRDLKGNMVTELVEGVFLGLLGEFHACVRVFVVDGRQLVSRKLAQATYAANRPRSGG